MEFIQEGNFTISELEQEAIHKEASKEALSRGEEIDNIHIWQDANGYLCYQPHYKRDIQRVRRITGYFSEVSNFNSAKKAELGDRVSHI